VQVQAAGGVGKMRPELRMIPGLIIGMFIGSILAAIFEELTLGLIIPLLILILAGTFTLYKTGKMNEWLHDPEMILP
jgi:F0F1-type ATP synthase assembly protein I